ncbi:MAG TPA: hypothetical protein VHW65_10410 [Gemmatimonadales bacterium]|jgi:hypothetical protein|nr:hypothetical protein [Gemmatimonadales bacterium]
MRIAAGFAVAGALVGAVLPVSAQRPPQRCNIQETNVDHNWQQLEPFGTNKIEYFGGNVRFACLNRNVHLSADSVEAINEEVWHFYAGHGRRARYVDSAYTVDADTLIYTKKDEQVLAIGNALVTDLAAGSTLRGPHLQYFRAVEGVRNTAITIALAQGTDRPVVHYFPKDTARTAAKGAPRPSPYLLVADQMHGFGQSQFWGKGNVTIDRDSLRGRGDSVTFASGQTGTAQLFGTPAVMRRVGADSFMVAGKEVRLGLDGDHLRDVRAYGKGHVTHSGSEIVADSVALEFTAEKLSLTLAWDRKDTARVHNGGFDTRGDSVVIDSPGELLHEVRVFGNGLMQSPRDTTAARTPAGPDSAGTGLPDRNELWGERIVASFAQADSAGTQVTRVRQIRAAGTARSFSTDPINYTRADTVVVTMKRGDSTGVSAVRAWGHMDGVLAQKATTRSDSSRADSAKALAKPPRKVHHP